MSVSYKPRFQDLPKHQEQVRTFLGQQNHRAVKVRCSSGLDSMMQERIALAAFPNRGFLPYWCNSVSLISLLLPSPM